MVAQTPLDRLADVVARMSERPWRGHHETSFDDACVGHKHFVRENGEEDFHSVALCAYGGADAAGIAALRNVADALIDVARAAFAGADTGTIDASSVINARYELYAAILAALGKGT